ncbi:ArsR/SmtB family transcription factor [Promicromonospora citrea]|uniref:Transcriptional regulator n=1 Tax=Promicromonospora citrea TaxID=43677 RepID=A0A8H9GP70_9MICO|nr:ArsR family transcriptional regulator [Promicromonospora citrea]NNH50853.1 helix-turn-helix transcriptional regulator [Promicromonospora citrea]GGM35446.1 transcriptional regulator [Promicromonospora citrea]
MNEYPSPDIADVELVDVLRALADPVRLQIVGMLADGKPYPKGDCLMGLDLSKSTASHHFRTLREAGLTRTIVHGRTHDIQLRRDELDEKFPGLLPSVLGSAPPT